MTMQTGAIEKYPRFCYNKDGKRGTKSMSKMSKIKDGIPEIRPTKGLKMCERGNTKPSDEYYTKRETVEHLEEKMRHILKKYDMIICCFDSEQSEFVKVLTELNYNVLYSSDDYKNHLNEYKELLKTKKVCIFSNPPFSIWKEIIKNLQSINIDYYLINNLLNANKAYRLGAYGSYIGKCTFSNGKDVPCFLMSNNDIRDVCLKLEAKQSVTPEHEGIKIYTSYKKWKDACEPDKCYIYSTFCLTPESKNYILKPAEIKGYYRLFYIERK